MHYDTSFCKYSRAALVINTEHIANNVRCIRKLTNPASRLMAVVKADGYGHGICQVAKAAVSAGVDCLGVATVREGLDLRTAGIDAPVLVLSPVFEEEFEAMLQGNLACTVFNLSECEKLSQIAQKLNITAKVHIKIDTGMNRVGYSYSNTPALIREISAISIMRYIRVDGIYSHLATSDSDAEFANEQFTRFSAVCHALISSGVYIPVKHISNSGAVINHPSFNLDMVRCGIILYGLAPCSTPEGAKALTELGFKPALTLKSRISHIKTIRAGESVGYGRNFFATDDTVVASIPLGYADGISRKLSNTGTVLVNGKVCRIIGNVCMDQLMVNVTGANAALRGEVVFIGQDGWHTQTAEDIASLQGTINYEVATSLSLRLPTYYTAQ